ncbi:NAD(P)/FAD-dependent oxidoreductase [Anaerofustis sp. NSJ-163]|uniref:NAD(P)/FAD-dependent oxidoreductase n=1 Tax=Anaerofustis sp. NSJ-163 TaxID=2944391 RepID=UPI00209BBF32|nr:NAD(P)/FAD-dependent oxidoreductase [Anaerofustis sp. NSJ-163]MCO8192936.1 NAD(P)/FAD-dependent oxidoreductase [Anaerofustis sp. NSJ-163]
MTNNLSNLDVIIIGGGAAGIMAAISSLECNKKVLLIEKNEKIGKKIYITGKGRCNVTNNKDISEFFDHIVKNKEFLYSALYTFDNTRLLEMLNKNGLKTKVERGDRVFPVSDKASDVTKTLLNIAKKYPDFNIMYNIELKDIILNENNEAIGVLLNNKEKIYAKNIILATGGKSYPSTGSDGYGYIVAKKLGHKIINPVPALVQMLSDDKWVHDLMGLTLKNVDVTLMIKGKKKNSQFGELLFTHKGISGPTILYLSNFINMDKLPETKIKIDLKPALDFKTLEKRIIRDFEKNQNKMVKNSLDLLLPKSLAAKIIELSKINKEKQINQITKEERKIILNLIKDLQVNITGLGSFKEAIITNGGINVKEINPSTMESRLIKNLFFAGEIIDVHAVTGGYNLQIAFSTGYLAGQNLH